MERHKKQIVKMYFYGIAFFFIAMEEFRKRFSEKTLWCAHKKLFKWVALVFKFERHNHTLSVPDFTHSEKMSEIQKKLLKLFLYVSFAILCSHKNHEKQEKQSI